MLPHLVTLLSFVLFAAITLAFIRLCLGPTIPDRIIAFDLIAALFMAQLILWSFHYGNPFLIEIAAGIALVSFIATVALARYLECRRES